jgi:CheY-like chemotaxis protein
MTLSQGVAKKKILVIDDENNVTKFLKTILESSGRYEVCCENAGVNAVKVAKSFMPNIVLLDVVMPDISGGEILEMFQQDPTLKNLPVIFLTCIVSDKEMKEGVTIVGRPTVSKPIDMECLIDCIEKTLEISQR